MEKDQTPEILTPEQVQDYLQITRSIFMELVEKGSIPGIINLGGILRIKRDTLFEWIESGGAPIDEQPKVMNLHEAILETLRRHDNRGLTVKEIADYIETHELYHKKMAKPSSQVSARIRRYSWLFRTDKSTGKRLIYAADDEL